MSGSGPPFKECRRFPNPGAPRRAARTNVALIDLATSYGYDALDRIVKGTDSLGHEVKQPRCQWSVAECHQPLQERCQL